MSEQFKRIKDYPEYEINDKGVVRRYGKIRKQTLTPKGYLRIRLSKGCVIKNLFVHRLVYQTFVGEIPEGYFVNHIDENKQNNSVENLNLMTSKENDNWGTRNSRIGCKSKVYILQKTFDGEVVNRWNSSKKLLSKEGLCYTCILRCCQGLIKHYKGFRWEFEK